MQIITSSSLNNKFKLLSPAPTTTLASILQILPIVQYLSVISLERLNQECDFFSLMIPSLPACVKRHELGWEIWQQMWP